MKMVKSLLLGTAAGLVAVTAGQAADLPVKAKPVEYVKVCSLYGAGFYYMPGTDMCIKIGGWVRSEVRWGVNGSSTAAGYTANYNNRYTNNFWTRERGYITADAREQTAYGVARGYIAVGIASNNSGGEANANQFSSNRAFVQWAGFTTGQTVSFFDFYPAAALLIDAGYALSEDSGDGGWWVWGYTAQFGGGFSATISAEERRMSQIIVASGGAAVPGVVGFANPIPALGSASGPTTPGSDGTLTGFTSGAGYGGWQSPDIIANLRADQTWGSAQIMGAAHEVNPAYYGATPATGHASDTWGWVGGVGLRLNTPFISQGDYFVAEANYTEGATKYLNHSGSGNTMEIVHGATEGYGIGSDCVIGGTVAAGTTTGCNLTTAWSVNAAYEHYWTPAWHQSLVGSYFEERYNNQANAILCVAEGQGAIGTGVGTGAVAGTGCNNNWSYWAVGSRLQWDVTKSFYLAVDVLYTKLKSATPSVGGLPPNVTLANSGATTVSDQSNWIVGLRIHKDFLP